MQLIAMQSNVNHSNENQNNANSMITRVTHELEWVTPGGPILANIFEPRLLAIPREQRWCFGTAAIVRPRALPRDDTNTSAPDVWNNHTPGYHDLQHLCSSGKCA